MEENKNTHLFERTGVDGDIFYGGLYKRIIEMAELKGVLYLFNTFGWTAFIYGLFVSIFNMDVFTRSVLSFLGMLFILAKIIVYIISFRDKRKMHTIERQIRDLERQKLFNDEKERELNIRMTEVDVYERENSIIKGYEGN